MKTINETLAIWMTLCLGSMWTFYACVVIGLIPVVIPTTESSLLYWSNFIQLIFLPVIMVGQDILGQGAKRQALEDHKRIKLILDDFNQAIEKHHKELKTLKALIQNERHKDSVSKNEQQ